MEGLKPPYFIEFHAPYGHAILPERYPTPDAAIERAQALQARVTDDAYYCVSNKDQELVWPPRGVLFPFLPYRYEDGM